MIQGLEYKKVTSFLEAKLVLLHFHTQASFKKYVWIMLENPRPNIEDMFIY